MRDFCALLTTTPGGLVAGFQKSSLSPLLNPAPQVRELVVNQVHRRNDAAHRPNPKIFNTNPDGAIF
jgi:hypothetical protein